MNQRKRRKQKRKLLNLWVVEYKRRHDKWVRTCNRLRVAAEQYNTWTGLGTDPIYPPRPSQLRSGKFVRKLRAVWTHEPNQNLIAMYGIGADTELADAIAADMELEIDLAAEIVADAALDETRGDCLEQKEA